MKSRANRIVGGLVALLLIVAFGLYMGMQVGGANAEGLQAVVHDGDGIAHRLELSKDQELAVQTSLGLNVIVVENGSVFVREANCDNQDCVHQGPINAPGRQIICLPHKLWIEVVVGDDTGTGNMDKGAVAGSSNAEGLDVIAR